MQQSLNRSGWLGPVAIFLLVVVALLILVGMMLTLWYSAGLT